MVHSTPNISSHSYQISLAIFSDSLTQDGSESYTCENCHKSFDSNRGRNTHIGKSKKGCKSHYGKRFEEMKKIRLRKNNTNFRKKYGIKKQLAREKERYARNPELKRKANNDYYKKNQEILSTGSRNRARESKLDSDANLTKFHEETTFGHNFSSKK